MVNEEYGLGLEGTNQSPSKDSGTERCIFSCAPTEYAPKATTIITDRTDLCIACLLWHSFVFSEGTVAIGIPSEHVALLHAAYYSSLLSGYHIYRCFHKPTNSPFSGVFMDDSEDCVKAETVRSSQDDEPF
jgi:hypothetical protein